MITNILRRLQGRPAPRAPAADTPACADVADRCAADDAQTDVEYTLDAASLESHFLAWAFDLPDGAEHDVTSADAAFAHLQLVAQRFDVRRMPRLPAWLPLVLAALRDDHSNANDIATLLERDPTLAAAIIEVAGSSFYRGARAAADLPQAVHALGDDALRQLVLASVLRPILRGDITQAGSGVAMRLWSHTQVTTWLCGRIASDRCDTGEAQLAGIVAGSGLAALTRMVPASMLVDAAGHADFATRLAHIARPLSTRTAAHWHLPAPVIDTLKAAEDPVTCNNATARVLRAAERHAMGHCLVQAGWLPPDATWPTGISGCDAAGTRSALWETMRDELAALAPESALR